MVDAPTFAVYDQLSPDGQRAPGAFTRAQGLMLGAALELGAATGEPHFATEAHGFGDYLVSKLTQTSSAGQVLDDGANCNADCAAYKGVGYRYLAELFRQAPTNTNYRDVLTNSAKAIWDLARAPTTNYFASELVRRNVDCQRCRSAERRGRGSQPVRDVVRLGPGGKSPARRRL